MTFNIEGDHWLGSRYNWKNFFECFSVCRGCGKSTIFILAQNESSSAGFFANNGVSSIDGCVNEIFTVTDFVSLKDMAGLAPPEHIPEKIKSIFVEGSLCLSIGCPNAASTMFRLCLDMATSDPLATGTSDAPPSRVKNVLGLRLGWLFENKILPDSLKDLSSCIKDDGNDGAHEGTLNKEDAEDIQEFTFVLLERLYTEPEKINRANQRRKLRREGAKAKK